MISDPSSQPRFGYWEHRKGNVYEILGFAVREKDCIPVVIYQAVNSQTIWTRPCVEFFDGRFIRIEQ